jgi:hypothetical protein
MEDLFRGYWWLMFPLIGFAFAGWDRYLNYRRYRDNIELLKSYAAQGREPPPEVMRAATMPEMKDWSGMWEPGPGALPPGPHRDWRKVALFGALSGAFFFTALIMGDRGFYEPFLIVSVIMGALALAFAATALLATFWKPK